MKCVFLILLECVSLNTFSQEGPATIQQTIGLKPEVYKRILNQQFTGLISGQSKNFVGNFASLDLKEAEVSVAGNALFKGGSVLAVKASGSVTDGLYDIFSNSKLNTKVSLDFQWNVLGLGRRSIQYYDDSYRSYERKQRKIRSESAARILKLERGIVADSLADKRDELIAELSKLEEKKGSLRDANGSVSQVNQKCYDSLLYRQAADTALLSSTKFEVSNFDKDDLVNDVNNSRGNNLKNIETMIAIYGFRFGWFSFGYKLQNDAFKLFNPAALYENQIEKRNYVSHEFRLQYSYYSYSTSVFESFYWDIGLVPTVINNVSELEKVEISESQVIGTAAGQRSTTLKYDAYIGDYKKNILALRFYGDAYYFLFRDNIAALHMFPEISVKDGYKPVSNLSFGFLLSFKDAKDVSALVNTELYYNFVDVFNVKHSGYKLTERNNIGLRFIFPIKFLNK